MTLSSPNMVTLFDWIPHEVIPGGIHGVKKFENGWTVSVVAGLPGCGLHGHITENTWEVAVMCPSGEIFGDVSVYLSSEKVHGIVDMVRNFPETSTFTQWCHPESGIASSDTL